MFKTLRTTEPKQLNHSGRSHVGESLQLEWDLRSSGSIDVSGLINGNVYVSEMVTGVYVIQYYGDKHPDYDYPPLFDAWTI